MQQHIERGGGGVGFCNASPADDGKLVQECNISSKLEVAARLKWVRVIRNCVCTSFERIAGVVRRFHVRFY